jgi:hypothetical protein
MKNIHVLPTKGLSRLVKGETTGRLLLHDIYGTSTDRNETQNIYITNLEEIKDADWFITEKNTICKCVKVDEKYAYSIEAGSRSKNNCKKIILTTDQDLIKDGVQDIDDEFLEWFVKNPSCESVEVDDKLLQSGYTYYRKNILNNQNLYKIIIPKEEQSDILEAGQILVNEETLEYGLLQHIKTRLECNNESQAIRLLEKYGFEKQEERYSEEEVVELCKQFATFIQQKRPSYKKQLEWFEQFKKK